MNHRGVEFTLVQIEPGLWRWQFQIGQTLATGKTAAKLKGLATRRVQQRIDRELRKSCNLNREQIQITDLSASSLISFNTLN
jgi:hypothetical protein